MGSAGAADAETHSARESSVFLWGRSANQLLHVTPLSTLLLHRCCCPAADAGPASDGQASRGGEEPCLGGSTGSQGGSTSGCRPHSPGARVCSPASPHSSTSGTAGPTRSPAAAGVWFQAGACLRHLYERLSEGLCRCGLRTAFAGCMVLSALFTSPHFTRCSACKLLYKVLDPCSQPHMPARVSSCYQNPPLFTHDRAWARTSCGRSLSPLGPWTASAWCETQQAIP